MSAPVGFPDAVAVVRAYLLEALAEHGQTVRVVSKVPNPRPPRFVRLERIGGARLDLITDRPRLDVECWGTDEDDANDLANVTRALLLAIPGWRGTAIAYDVDEVGGPNTMPDSETGHDRTVLAVEVSLRGKRLAP